MNNIFTKEVYHLDFKTGIVTVLDIYTGEIFAEFDPKKNSAPVQKNSIWLFFVLVFFFLVYLFLA